MIDLIPLSTQHLSLLHGWLNQPHMRLHYQREPITFEQVTKKYQDRITYQQPVICYIACYDDKPFGFIQGYKNQDQPDYAAVIGIHTGISLDLFIGEPTFLSKGLGREMLRAYMDHKAFEDFPHQTECYICHNINNVAAIRCSTMVGFKYVKDVIEDDGLSQLFVFQRNK